MKYSYLQILCLFCLLVSISSCKSDDDSSTQNDPRAENRKSLGVSAEDLLSDDIYAELVVELVYSGAYRPTEATITNLRNFLEARVSKPSGISFVETPIDSQSGAPYTIEEIKDIEDAQRTRYTDGTTITVYIFFANGNSANDNGNSVTLGSAYLNTSIVVFEKTIQDVVIANPSVSLSDLESTTIQHEFGHIFALVNLRDDDIHTLHQDPNITHGKHCMVEDCLMYYQTSNTLRLLERFRNQSSIPILDPLCIEDLQAKGGL